MGWFCHGDETGGKGWGRPELAGCGPRKEMGGGSHSCLAVVLRVILFGFWLCLVGVLVGDQNANRRGKKRGNIILGGHVDYSRVTIIFILLYFNSFIHVYVNI